jgi:hypothetical protein
MNRVRRIAKLLAICCVCAVMSLAEGTKEPDMSKGAGVAMEIAELDVNDSTLTLSYKIINGTDRDAWVCSSVDSFAPFEVFLTSDKQTLLIRKRLDVPTAAMWRPPGPVGTYVRIAPGASLADSVRIAVPVGPVFQYASPDTTAVAQTVTGLALEIGYYDADLPATIRSIIAVAEKSGLTVRDVPGSLLDTYFRGLRVRGALGDFDLMNENPYDQGYVRLTYSGQAFTGEKILRVDVNNVSIPYEGYSQWGGRGQVLQ